MIKWNALNLRNCIKKEDELRLVEKFATNIPVKGLSSRICKELSKFNIRKKIQLEDGQKALIAILLKRTYKSKISTGKDTQHHQSLGT